MAKRVNALINPALLKWAREGGGFTLTTAADHLKEDESVVRAWEEGKKTPSLTQLKKIARAYRRPVTAFYLPEPPSEDVRPFNEIEFIDYRNLPDIEKENHTPAALYELRKAEVRRDILLEIDRWRDIETPHFELQRESGESAVSLAKRVRNNFEISSQQQLRWRDHDKAYAAWRRAIEAQGVLVFQTRYEKKFVVDLREWRGVAIHYPQLPIVIVNRKDKPAAKIFTLFHELCHLIRKESSLVSKDSLSGRQEEIYCNRFAGNILVPESTLRSDQIVQEHIGGEIWSDTEIETLSKRYSVSRVVILRRLLDLQYTSSVFYQRKTKQYDDEAADEELREEKKGGRATPHKQPLNTYGGLFVSRIFSAYRDDFLTLLDVTQHLDTKTKHIKAIQQELPNYLSSK